MTNSQWAPLANNCVCNWLLWFHKASGILTKRGTDASDNIHSLNPTSDPPQHTSDPPVARHDDVTDDVASSVVVRPWVEATQGREVAAAVAVTTATVLAAVAAVIQTAIQLDSNVSL